MATSDDNDKIDKGTSKNQEHESTSEDDLTKELDAYSKEAEEMRQAILADEKEDKVVLANYVYKLWWNWADLQLYVVSPTIEAIKPPVLIPPATNQQGEVDEFVYNILDHGYELSTSKSEDMFSAGMSMCKLYYTIEKMIALLVERLDGAGINTETEVQVAIHGHELAQRKAFESIINVPYNIIVNNFDPGLWGENYLELVKVIADKGYGYPSEAPRDIYKKSAHETSKKGPKGN